MSTFEEMFTNAPEGAEGSFSSKRDNYVHEELQIINRYTGNLEHDAQFSVLYICDFLYHAGAFFRSFSFHVGLNGYEGPFTDNPTLIKSIIQGGLIKRSDSVTISQGFDILTRAWEMHMDPSAETMVNYFIQVCEVLEVLILIKCYDWGDLVKKMRRAMTNYNLVVIPAEVDTHLEMFQWLTKQDCPFMLKLRSSKRLMEFPNADVIKKDIIQMDDQLRVVAARAREILDGKKGVDLSAILRDKRWSANKIAPIPYFYDLDTSAMYGKDCTPERLMKTQAVQDLIANTTISSGKSPLRTNKQLKQLAQLIFVTNAYQDDSCFKMGQEISKLNDRGKPPSVLYNPNWIHEYLLDVDRNRQLPIPKCVIRGIISTVKSLGLEEGIHHVGRPQPRSQAEGVTKPLRVTKQNIMAQNRLDTADNPSTSETGMILPILLAGIAIFLVMK